MRLLVLALLVTLPAPVAVAQEPPVVSALMAQVDGLGGCPVLDSVRTVRLPFWPSLTFYRGQCTLEHGDPAAPWAVRLSDGSILPLGSEVAFRYLIRREPPVAVTEATQMDYVEAALHLMSKLPANAVLIHDPAKDVSQRLCKKVDLKCSGLYRPRFDPTPRGTLTLYLTFATADAIFTVGPGILDPATGALLALVTEHEKGGHHLH